MPLLHSSSHLPLLPRPLTPPPPTLQPWLAFGLRTLGDAFFGTPLTEPRISYGFKEVCHALVMITTCVNDLDDEGPLQHMASCHHPLRINLVPG